MMRRGLIAVLLSGLVGLSSLPAIAWGQQPDDSSPAKHVEARLTLPTHPASVRNLGAFAEYVAQQSWVEATQLLQSLLDGPDAFVPLKGLEGKDETRWTTLHAEAFRLFGTLPAPGRDYYERSQGQRSRNLLADAGDNPYLLAEVSRRFPYTAAGIEATQHLALHHLDRGRPALAALCFERLLRLTDSDRLPSGVLPSAFLAFQRAGDQVRAGEVWRLLAARAPGGLRIQGRAVSLQELQAWLAQDRSRPTAPAADWPMFRGTAARASQISRGELPAQAAWRRTTVHEAATRTWLDEASRQQEIRGDLVPPAFHPIAVRGLVVFRSHRGIHALDSRTGEPLWECESPGSLDTLGQDLGCFPYLESWVNAHLQHNPHVLAGNSVIGSLSSDNERVYAVEDLAVPPHQNTYLYRGRPVSVLEYAFGPHLSAAARHSELIALDLTSGKVLWERGTPATGKRTDDLHPCWFLGPPLPVGGRLYGVIEKDQELRLVCLDAARGELLWILPLGVAPSRLLADPGRRLQAVPLAWADGILVCPTNAGYVLGIDVISRAFLWAYPYREPSPPPEEALDFRGRAGWRGRTPIPLPAPRLSPVWAAAAPLLHAGEVVFTAPDSLSIHCINLRDGSPRWRSPRKVTDLYLAAVGQGKVLVVGKQTCRALGLTDGQLLWEQPTGSPAGLGALTGSAYCLPLNAMPLGSQPSIRVIDPNTGHCRDSIMLARDVSLGNLLFHGDMVLSQSATQITAYRQRPTVGPGP